MSEKRSFGPEIYVYRFIASIIEFLEELMDKAGWAMSPSRFYLAIYETIAWCRERRLWHFKQPAFLYVMEQMKSRAESLATTYDDESRVMEMSVWRDRKKPIPGGIYSLLYILDWFLPILRSMESNMVRYYGNPSQTASGHEFTEYEAWDTVFNAVDKLYKDKRFGEYTNWGQMKAFPWVQFVRDEMYEMKQALKPSAPPAPPGYEPPFSKP